MVGFERYSRIIDDSLMWDIELEDYFFHVCRFLEITGQNGVIQTPSKFAFGRKSLEFVGFQLTPVGMGPTEETLKAITEFPRPKNITGVRSFFGLIEQVSYAFSKAHEMEPFRELLSPKAEFTWSQKLQESFEIAKKVIVDSIKNGVQTYVSDRVTVLVSDWSKVGVGHMLLRKLCAFKGVNLDCCKTGWVIICIGSRFLTAAESRYSAVKGELLGLTWALERTQFWTLGNSQLWLLTDHKPLSGWLDNRNFDDIANPRLARMVEKTLRWGFKILHLPGLKNMSCDALSRYPWSKVSSDDTNEDQNMKQFDAIDNSQYGAIDWNDVIKESEIDLDIVAVVKMLDDNSYDVVAWRQVQKWSPGKKFLRVVDKALLYKDRVVIPASLRDNILRWSIVLITVLQR